MLVIINDKKNIETGILQAKDQYKEQLANYRNTLLENTSNNFTETITYQTREDGPCDISKKKMIYPKGDFLIKEEYVELQGNRIPFKTYVYLVQKTQIECKSLVTIQVLTRLLKDWYKIEELDPIADFIRTDIMKVSLRRNEPISEEWINFYYENVHKGIETLLKPEKSSDLNSFRNSLYFLEYWVSNEYSWQDLVTSPLNTPINQVAANSEVLFGGPLKVLRKNR